MQDRSIDRQINYIVDAKRPEKNSRTKLIHLSLEEAKKSLFYYLNQMYSI